MMTIKKLAAEAGVPAHVARYYVRIGLIEPVSQQENGYRLFSLQAAERIRFVRMAKHLGFSLSEIGQIFSEVAADESPCADVREMLARRIEENRKKIEELTALQARMESAQSLWNWMPDGQAGDHAFCPLIAAVTRRENPSPTPEPEPEVQDAAC